MANKELELALRIVAEATGKQHIEQLVDELRRISDESDTANPKTKALSQGIDELTQSSQTSSTQAGALANELEQLANQQDLINSFKRSRNELEQQEVAVTAAAMALDDLQKRAAKTDAPFVELARNIDTAEKELGQMRKELGKSTARHTKLQQALSKSGIDYNNLNVAQRKVSAGFDKTGHKVDKFSEQLEKGSASSKRNADSLRGMIGQVTALAAAYFGLDRVAQAVKDVFTTGDKFERLGVQFTGLMGSFEQGEKATEWVKEFTKKTPLQLDEVSRAFVKLKAFGLDPMDGSMQAIVDQAFKLGGSFQEVEGISLALGQAWAKQKLQGEEILQLVERGVPVWDLLAKATGKNTQELQKLSTAGKLGRDVIKQLMDEMGKGAEGAAAANMALLSGQVSNAKDNLDQFYNLISTSGAMDWLKGQIGELNKEFAAMAADGRLKQWAQQMSDSIVAVGSAVQDGAKLLYDYREEIGFVAKAWLALKVGSYFTDITKGAYSAIAAMRLYTASVTGSTKATQAATLAASKWKTALKAVGRAGLYLWLIEELVQVGMLYRDLLVAQEAAIAAQRRAESSTKLLAYTLADLSEQTGVAFKTMTEFNKAVDDGLLIYDEAQGKWKSTAVAIKEVKEAAEAVVEPMRLTVDQALKLTLTLNDQASSLDKVKGGMGGFIRQIDAALIPLKAAGEQYQNQVKLLEQLKDKYQEQKTYLEATAKGAGALEQAYKDLGLTSTDALEKTAEKSKAAFELIRDSKEPVEQIKEAFLKYAKAAITAAEASGNTVPANLKAQAAALELSDEYQKLTDKTQRYKESASGIGSIKQALIKDISNTTRELKSYREAINASTDVNDENGKSLVNLALKTGELQEKTKLLSEIKQLESANFGQLQARYESTNNELDKLNHSYKNGAINSEEYNRQKERLVQLLRVLQQLMGGLGDEEQDTGEQVKNTTDSLIEQREEMERLEQQTGRATQFISLFSQAQAYLEQNIDTTDKTTEELAARIDVLNEKIVLASRVTSVWWQELAQKFSRGFERERQILQETIAIRNYTAELENSSITLARVNQIALRVKYDFKQLGEEQLKPLHSAIDTARDKILGLRDDINGTLSSLKDELDGLNNNQTAIEKRRYDNQQAELKAQLAAAKQAEDGATIKSAQAALALSQQIYQTKLKQLQAQQQERAEQDKSISKTASSSPTVSAPVPKTALPSVDSSPVQRVTDTVRLELVMPSGSVVKADLLNEFKQLLFTELEQIKATS